MNNEPSIVSQSRIEEADFSIMKIIMLGLFSIGTSLAMVYEFGEFLSSPQYAFLWFGVIALFMFLVMNILNTFFIKRFSIIAGVVLLETGLPLLLFLNKIKTEAWPLSIGFFLFFVFTLAGVMRGRGHLGNSIKIKFFATTKMITAKLVTGVLIGVSTVFYIQCFSVGGACVEGFGREVLNQTLTLSKPIVNIWIPNVSADQPVSEFFQQFAISEMGNVQYNGGLTSINPKNGISELPVETRTKIVSQFSGEIQKSIEQKTGPLNAKASVRSEVLRLISEYLRKLPTAMQTLASIGLAVLFFFSLKGIAFLFYWFVDLIAFLVYKLLIAADFAAVTYETRNREFVILP